MKIAAESDVRKGHTSMMPRLSAFALLVLSLSIAVPAAAQPEPPSDVGKAVILASNSVLLGQGVHITDGDGNTTEIRKSGTEDGEEDD